LVASLNSDRAYVEMAGVISLWLCCMATSKSRETFFSIPYLCFLFSATSIITTLYLWFILTPHTGIAPDLEKSAGNNYIFLLVVVLFVVSLRALIASHIQRVSAALAMLITANSAILFIQTITLVATKHYIDFVKPVTGESSRYLNYESVNPIFAYRPTGLYVEPSTFSAAVAVMTIGYILLSRARASQPAKLPILLAVTAMLVTQSAAAVVQAGILLIGAFAIQKSNTKLWWGIALALAILIFPGLIAAYFDSFVLKFDADSGIRMGLVSYIFKIRQGWDFVFGFGPFSLESDLYNLASSTDVPKVSSLNDAGLFNFFVTKFGISGLLIPIWIFSRMKRDLAGMLFFALIMSCKISYADPVLFLGLLPLISRFPNPKGSTESRSRQERRDRPGTPADSRLNRNIA
jgi:hypothetical protein